MKPIQGEPGVIDELARYEMARTGRVRGISAGGCERGASARMRGLASPTMPSWNQVGDWLRDMDSLRTAVSGAVA